VKRKTRKEKREKKSVKRKSGKEKREKKSGN
jgi:hypothetical protein